MLFLPAQLERRHAHQHGTYPGYQSTSKWSCWIGNRFHLTPNAHSAQKSASVQTCYSLLPPTVHRVIVKKEQERQQVVALNQPKLIGHIFYRTVSVTKKPIHLSI